MMYTKEQMIAAFVAGTDWGNQLVTFTEPPERCLDAGERYVTGLHDAPRRPLEASGIDQPSSSYLPPDGTPEEVLARVVGSLMFRVFQAARNPEKADWWLSGDWFWPTMEGLRTAYPVLAAVEDVRVEEGV